MARTSESLDLLRFMALSASVHADAALCAVDDTRKAIIQMSADKEAINAVEEQLTVALQRQQRVHAVHGIVTQSREDRRATQHLLRGVDRTADDPHPERHLRHRGKTVQSSKRVKAQRPESDVSPMLSNLEAEGDTPGAVLAVDDEVRELKRRLQSLDDMAVQTKLLRLEVLLQRAQQVDGDALMQQLVDPFTFSPDVENLWEDGVHKKTGEAGAAVHNVINHTNVEPLTRRACARFAGRCEDALQALTCADLGASSDAERIFGCLLYANLLGNPNNDEIAAVQTLQSTPDTFFSEEYQILKGQATFDAAVAPRCYQADGGTILSNYEFCALPTDWPVTEALCSVPRDALLPPTRHITTPRFSFSHKEELKKLEQLRVDIQRAAVDRIVRSDGLLEDAWKTMVPLRASGSRDRAVAAARLRMHDTSSARKPHAWMTIMSDTKR